MLADLFMGWSLISDEVGENEVITRASLVTSFLPPCRGFIAAGSFITSYSWLPSVRWELLYCQTISLPAATNRILQQVFPDSRPARLCLVVLDCSPQRPLTRLGNGWQWEQYNGIAGIDSNQTTRLTLLPYYSAPDGTTDNLQWNFTMNRNLIELTGAGERGYRAEPGMARFSSR